MSVGQCVGSSVQGRSAVGNSTIGNSHTNTHYLDGHSTNFVAHIFLHFSFKICTIFVSLNQL